MANFIILVLIALTVFASLDPSQATDIRNGFYRIQSVPDALVLQATLEGRPRIVITSDWRDDEPAQEWKIKAIPGTPFHMIRNEEIRDNEVNKHAGPHVDGKLTLEANEWRLVQTGSANTFTFNNGGKCLQSNGYNQRIGLNECAPNTPAQQWTISFLYDL